MLFKRFIEYIENQKLFVPNQKILLAVSGGIDSMVMVSLFSMAKFDFGIAHCNFMLRGSESDEDAAFVKKTALGLGVLYFEKYFNTKELASQKKLSIQVAARELRYEWFNQLIVENNFDYFATAHQFDDQIETFFINLFRGTGISGLRGILPKNEKCVRPLLFARRDEIKEFAADNSILYREDSSNEGDKYLRNKIRHVVIPALESVHPDLRRGFSATFKNLAGAEKILAGEITKKSSELFVYEDDKIKMDLKNLQNLDPLPVYLYEILKPFHFNFSTVEDICDSINGIAGKSFFSPTHCLNGNSKFVEIKPLGETDLEEDTEFSIEENMDIISEPLHLTFQKVEIEGKFTIQKDVSIALLDFEKLHFPLKLRKWKAGDHFVPLGMKGRKLLSDYFIDTKFPVDEKHKTWLLVSGKDIVWIIGHRINNKYKITEKSSKALIIKQI